MKIKLTYLCTYLYNVFIYRCFSMNGSRIYQKMYIFCDKITQQKQILYDINCMYHSLFIYVIYLSKMISNVLSIILCASSFVYTCYILCNLTYFLSSHNNKNDSLRMVSDNTIQSTLWSLLIDMSLLSIFIIQHSIMASDFIKHIFFKLHTEYLSRSIYNACSSASLHFLINKWQQSPALKVWNIETSSDTIRMLFSSLHVFSWCIIYSGCIMMDIAELCGLKQVWYKVSGKNSPLDAKSKELRRYIKHMRHPSFIGFLTILWIYPVMSMDRLLLAIILTIYMALMWTIDSEDYGYHIRYFRQKQVELSQLHRSYLMHIFLQFHF